MLLLVSVLLLATIVKSQVLFVGRCPNVTAVQNFEASKYLGKWYEIERYFAIFELGGKCVTATYTLNNNGSITVLNAQTSGITQSRSKITGIAKFTGPTTEAKLSVVFPSLPIRFAAPYWVIGTDYNNYAVVYSCVQVGFINSRNVWILTRVAMPSTETINAAYAVLNDNHITKSFLSKTNQKNCPAE